MSNVSIPSSSSEHKAAGMSLFSYLRKQKEKDEGMRKTVCFADLHEVKSQAEELQKELHYARHTIEQLENMTKQLKQQPNIVAAAKQQHKISKAKTRVRALQLKKKAQLKAWR